MIKNEIIEEKDLPIVIKHKKGEVVQMLGIKDMICPSCKKTFYRNLRDRKINKQIQCPWCENVFVNTSNNKFELKKYGD